MHRTAVFVAALLVTSAVGVAAPAAGSTMEGETRTNDLVTLEISVTDDDGDPVGRANVNVTYEGGYNETRTVSNGQALVDVPRGVSPQITVSHDEYVRNFPARVGEVTETTTAEVTVYPRSTAVIEVADSSGAVEDARVVLKKEGDLRTVERGRTNGDGVFESGDVEAGTYTATVVKEGYREATSEFSLEGTVSESIALEAARTNVDLTVLDAYFDDATPVGGASISIADDGETVATVTTDDRNGEAATRLGVNTEYDVTVEHPDYDAVERELEVGEQETIEATFNVTRTPTLTVNASESGVTVGETVRVVVTDEYGEVVGDAAVFRDDSQVGTTDANGVLSVPITETGEFEITAESGGVTSEAVAVEGVEADEGETTTPATDDDTATGEESSDGGGLPGFTAGAAIVALAGALVALRRRQ